MVTWLTWHGRGKHAAARTEPAAPLYVILVNKTAPLPMRQTCVRSQYTRAVIVPVHSSDFFNFEKFVIKRSMMHFKMPSIKFNQELVVLCIHVQ